MQGLNINHASKWGPRKHIAWLVVIEILDEFLLESSLHSIDCGL